MFHRSVFLSLVLIIAVFMLGCDQADDEVIAPPVDDNPSYELGQQIHIKYDETVIIKSEGLSVKFSKVTEDSRCPSDVTCIWAGRAVVVVSISRDGNELGELTLAKGAGDEELSTGSIGGYSIKLMNVSPYPISTQEIKLSQYVIIVIVTEDIDQNAC